MLYGLRRVLAVVILGGLVACGGGGGGEEGSQLPQTFTIGGRISGLGQGLKVGLLNDRGDALSVEANGSFSFSTPVVQNGSYAVTVGTQPTGQVCSVAQGSGAGVTANVASVQVICSAQTYAVGGSLQGLANGTQVTLHNNSGDPLTLSANGSFTFATPVAHSGSYAVTVGTQPTGQVCSVAQGSGAGVTANVASVQVICSAQTYTVGGSLQGLANGTQVTLHNNSGDPLTLSANGSFTFATPVAHSGSYAVTVGTQPTGQVCSVAQGSGAGVTANVASVQVICSAQTYTVGGSLQGLANGTQVTLRNNSGDPLTLSANGSFTFATLVAHSGSYAVTVGTQPTGQVCSVAQGSGAGVTANVASVQVICSAQTYTVGGSLQGLANGTQVTLRNNSGDPLTLSANGSFTFATPVAHSGSYAVTVGTQPTGQVCSVAQGSGAGVTANVASVQVICSAQTYTVGGSLQGLANGTQVTLRNNGGDPLTLTANGSFTFATPVAHSGSYAVTVETQPNTHICYVQNGAGSNVASNVNSVSVSCTSNCATTLSGVLSTNTTYGTAGSPYCISGSLQIPSGVSVIFSPGTSINGGRLVVQGALSVNGTVSARVRMTDVDVVPAGQLPANHNISIAFADVSGGSLYAPTGNAIYGSLKLTDSRVSNLGSYLYLWYPLGVNVIARNVFVGSGGISYGLDYRINPGLSLSIVNNYFGAWTTPYVLENWAQYGTGSTVIQDNTFASISQVVAKLPSGYTSVVIDASKNYWSTTSTAVIERMIYDKHVDVTSGGYVTYLPFLTSPSPNTPTP